MHTNNHPRIQLHIISDAGSQRASNQKSYNIGDIKRNSKICLSTKLSFSVSAFWLALGLESCKGGKSENITFTAQ